MKRTIIFAVCIGLLLFPIILNYILQLHITDHIIGNCENWLSFWGSYLAVIANMVMVYYAYKTIDVTIKTNKNSKKIKWHDDFRKAIISLKSQMDITVLRNLLQDLDDNLKNAESVKKRLILRQTEYNTTVYNLTLLLRDRDVIYSNNESIHLVKEVNTQLNPYLNSAIAIAQLASFVDGYLKGSYQKLDLEEILRIQDGVLLDYINRCNTQNRDFTSICHAIIMEIVKDISNIDYDKLDKVLYKIYEYDAGHSYEEIAKISI